MLVAIIKDKKPYSTPIPSIDFPIIDEDNAIFYQLQSDVSPSDYQKSFPVPNIDSGIISHDKRYFFFEHNIITTPRSHYNRDIIGSIASYNIYQITPDKFTEIKESDGQYNTWDLRFNGWINYGMHFNYVKNNSYITYKKILVPTIDGVLQLPYGINPSDMKDGDHISDFISNHCVQYPTKNFKKSISVYRNSVLESILG